MAIVTTNLENSLQTKIDAVTADASSSEFIILAKTIESVKEITPVSSVLQASIDEQQAIEDLSATKQNEIITEGNTQIDLVEAQGVTSVGLVTAEGDTQVARITNLGNTEVDEITTLTTTSLTSITDAKDDALSSIEADTASSLTQISNAGTTQVNLINSVVANIGAITDLQYQYSTSSPEYYWRESPTANNGFEIKIYWDGVVTVIAADDPSGDSMTSTEYNGHTYYRKADPETHDQVTGLKTYQITRTGTSVLEIVNSNEMIIQGVYDSLGDISSVSTNLDDVDTIITNLSDINTLSASILDVNAVADALPDINTVANNITNFGVTSVNGQVGDVEVASLAEFVATGAIASGDVVALRSDGTVEVINGSNAESWIGIADADIADGASGAISLKGDVNNQQTGLSTNSIYYLATDGSLTTTPTNYGVIGRAVSATGILLLKSGFADKSTLITNSDTAPSDPSEGDLWYDTSTGEIYVYVVDVDSSQWVQPSLGASSLQVVNSINGETGDITLVTGVSSVNGQTGDVTIDGGVTSVNGQTGDVTVASEKTVHGSEFTGASQSIDLDAADAFKSELSSDTSYSFITTTSSNILLQKNILISNTTKRAFEIRNPEITSQASRDTFLANFTEDPATWDPVHVRVKPDGTKLWIQNKVIASSLPALYQYSMSTPWDLSTLTFDGTNSRNTSYNQQFYRFDFSSDWSVVVIYRYDSPASAGDIWFYPGSTTSFDMTNNIDPEDTSQGNDAPFWNTNSVYKFGTAGENVSGSTYYDVWNAMRSDYIYAFNSDCTKVITNVAAGGSSVWGIYELDLSGLPTSPVSIVSEVSRITSSDLGSNYHNYYMRPQSISPDGKTIFWASEWGYISGQWKLDIAYDLTSIDLSRSFISIDSSDRNTDILSIAYSQDGTKAIIMDKLNENLISYDSGGEFQITYPTNAKLSADMPTTYGYGKKSLIEITSLDGGSNYYINPKVQNV